MNNISFFDEDCAGENPETPVASDMQDRRRRSQPEKWSPENELFSRIKNHFEGNVSPFYVPDRNTALALVFAAATEKNSLYLCSGTSYVATGGYASINRVAGLNPLKTSSDFGKLDPETITASLRTLPEDERERCNVVAISQPTEYGLVYTPEEIKAICLCAHEHDMLVLMDGARLFFATANLLKAFREQTLFAGVDAATFGAEKNGVSGGEAALIFKNEIAEKFQALQNDMALDLSGASAFSSGFDRLLTNRLWRRRALHANKMAADLGAGLSEIPGIRPVCTVETNKVLAEVTPDILRKLNTAYRLRTFRCPGHVVRFVTDYTTSDKEIKRLIDILR